jgi:hypothetical protein
MKLTARSSLALAAAALLIGGTALAPTASFAAHKGKCFGVNACKGHGACKTADNACKGQNACKGKGYVNLTKSSCEKKKGKFEA